MIFVNFKTYEQGAGEKALKLVQICQEVEKVTSIKIIPVVQTADVFRIVSKIDFSVWVQHVDDIEYGPNTGQILPEAVLAAGAQGTLLSHSENKLPVEVIQETVKRCQALGLKALVCTESVEEAKEIIGAKPDFLAYEPSELIGGRVSVASAKPGVIKDFVGQIKEIPIIVGAGIHTQEDVRVGIRLGATGVLVASDVVLAKNPKKELLDLAAGFKKN